MCLTHFEYQPLNPYTLLYVNYVEAHS